MELFEGHIHQASATNGLHCITVYPTPDPGFWIVSAPGRGDTKEPVPAAEIEAVLESWEIKPREWSHWPGNLLKYEELRRGR